MPKKKTPEEIAEAVGKAVEKPETLYKCECVNWIGYVEDVAKMLLEFDITAKIMGIGEISRGKPYLVEGHTGENGPKTERHEERFVKELFRHQDVRNSDFPYGRILNYQIPLKSSLKDKEVGKIDFVSQRENTLFLVEVKWGDNKETLLRASLEIATYHQLLEKKAFVCECVSKEERHDIKFSKAVLVGEDTECSREIGRINELPFLTELIKDLGIKLFLGNGSPRPFTCKGIEF